MPTISNFFGITIIMYLRDKEHNPPHIHAFYGDEAASFVISDGEIYEGFFPSKQKELVKEFILRYKTELLEMWNTEIYKKLKGLD